MDGLPQLGMNTLQGRAAASGAIWEARVQARNQLVDNFETVDDPRDVPIRRRDGRFAPGQDFLDEARPREAAFRLDDEFPRQDLGPADVTESPRGFVPTEATRRREVALGFEERTPVDDIDPFGDVAAQDGGGFGLTGAAEREVAAAELDPQYPEIGIDTGDVQPTGEGTFGLTPTAEREVAAERIEADTPLTEVAPDDVRRTDDGGFELRDSVIDANRGLFR